MRVSISAIGSVIMASDPSYQRDFVMPWIWPSSASFRKHIRHSPNFLMNPRGRPHRSQRFRCLTGWAVLKALGCFAFMIIEIFATLALPLPDLVGRLAESPTPGPSRLRWGGEPCRLVPPLHRDGEGVRGWGLAYVSYSIREMV